MDFSLRDKLTTALGMPSKPTCYIQQVWDGYKRHMSGKIIETQLPESVHLLDENFPYWIKLQWLNPNTNKWEDAPQALVVPQLESRIFSDEGYRLEDPRRARMLPHMPDLLKRLDSIHKKHPDCKIRGDYVYVQAQKNQLKVAFTMLDARIAKVIVVSSFHVSRSWLSKNVNPLSLYNKTKATP